MSQCPRCSRRNGTRRSACFYCGCAVAPRRTDYAAAIDRLVRPRRAGGEAHYVALLPRGRRTIDLSGLMSVLRLDDYQAQQLLRRTSPVVYEMDGAASAATLDRNLRELGLDCVRYTQADLDAVPPSRTIVSLTVEGCAPDVFGGGPYRQARSSLLVAEDLDGNALNLSLSDVQLALVGELQPPRRRRRSAYRAAPQVIVDLYGELHEPLRLVARVASVRGLGVKHYERTAGLTRFANWLPRAQPSLHVDRTFKYELMQLSSERFFGRGAYSPRGKPRGAVQLDDSPARATEWDEWSTRTWTIFRLRSAPRASTTVRAS